MRLHHLLFALLPGPSLSFLPTLHASRLLTPPTTLSIIPDPNLLFTLPDLLSTLPTTLPSLPSNLLSFSDQGQNLAGIFFQASLPPYLLFLYFLSFSRNQTPPLVQFGFSFLLVFVGSTIPAGIITKSQYGLSLADCDWLHGGAEALVSGTFPIRRA